MAAVEVLGGEAGQHGAAGVAGGLLAVGACVVGVAHALAVHAVTGVRAPAVPVAARWRVLAPLKPGRRIRLTVSVVCKRARRAAFYRAAGVKPQWHSTTLC